MGGRFDKPLGMKQIPPERPYGVLGGCFLGELFFVYPARVLRADLLGGLFLDYAARDPASWSYDDTTAEHKFIVMRK